MIVACLVVLVPRSGTGLLSRANGASYRSLGQRPGTHARQTPGALKGRPNLKQVFHLGEVRVAGRIRNLLRQRIQNRNGRELHPHPTGALPAKVFPRGVLRFSTTQRHQLRRTLCLGLIRPFRAHSLPPRRTHGVAMGYDIVPLWGVSCLRC